MKISHCFTGLLLCSLCTSAQVRTAAPEPANGNIPANLPALPVGNNDLLIISVYDAPELSRSVRVGADGYIRLPMLKQRIKAESVLPSQIEHTISAALIEEGILVDPVVTVSIAEYHSRPVSVAGAVRTPLTFQAAGPTTLLQAIAKAGGLEKNAGTEILVTRDEETLRVPVKALIEAAEPRWNLVLRGGEEIRVPEARRIFVVGNVKKPGAFLSSELTDATVLKAVALSEGLLPYSANKAFIYRPDGNGARTEIALDLNDIMDRKSPDVDLQPEDLLYIPDNKSKKLTAATLQKIFAFGSGATTALIYAGVR